MKNRILLAAITTIFITGCTLPITLGPATAISTTPSPLPSPTITPTATATPTPIPLPSDHLRSGEIAWFNGDYDKALDEYKLALNQTIDPQSIPPALLGIGRVFVARNDCVNAMDAFNQLISQYPQSAQVVLTYYLAGQCNKTSQNFTQEANAYNVFLQLKPGIIDDYIQRIKGDALFNAGDFPGAITAYQAALVANPPADSDTIQLDIAKSFNASGDTANAIKIYLDLYNTTLSDYTKATADLLMGRIYLDMGETDQANARFLDSVNNFPKSTDSYHALVQLVDSNVTVNNFNRGLVDYYAQQYYPAIDALVRYIKADPKHPGSAHYYLGLSYWWTDQFEQALQQYDSLITDHPDDKFWSAAWDEKAFILWSNSHQYSAAAQTLLNFVAQVPGSENAPGYLFEAARIYERGDLLPEAAANWERLINEYPTSSVSMWGLFLTGITRYRMGQFDKALVIFQRYLILAVTPGDKSAADFWIAKCKFATGDSTGAISEWQNAKQVDPGGYYGIRADERILNQTPFQAASTYDLGFDLNYDKLEAEAWVRSKFNVPASTDLSNLGELAGNIQLARGDLFWQLGLQDKASSEFETLRNDLSTDAVNSFRLLDHLIQIGLYRTAILTSRQILDLANLNDTTSLEAPIYFNHIRFGPYYRELVVSTAQTYGLNPLLLFSVIRQESLFESFIESSSGAIGLMQIMPATGQEVASKVHYPPNYTESDLYRPIVNILYGTSYLTGQKDYLNGDIMAAVAAYNAGAGNADAWMTLANNDPDLFMEIIRFDETRTYLQQIIEFLNIYRSIYER